MKNGKELANFILSFADLLRGDYKQSDYGKIILPLTVSRQLDCVLESTKADVLKKYEQLKTTNVENLDPILNKTASFKFHNKSQFDFDKLIAYENNIASNQRNYINGFSKNARVLIAIMRLKIAIILIIVGTVTIIKKLLVLEKIKKFSLSIIAIISFNFCFSQNSEIKIEGDSIFKVTPNSIFGNNYYLVCLPGDDEPKDILRRITGNEVNLDENKNLIWKKIKMVPGYGGFWMDAKKLTYLLKNNELLKESTFFQLTWDDINWSNNKLESNETLLIEKTNNIPNGKWIYKFKSEPNQTESIINKEVYGTFNNGLANGFWDKYETIRKNNVLIKFHYHQNYNNGVPQGEWYTEEDGKKKRSSFFLNGKAHGKWVFKDYGEGREIRREMGFKDGFKDGNYSWYINNQLFQSFEFCRGVLSGDVLQYFYTKPKYSNGKKYETIYLSLKAQYKNGNPCGNWEFYSENGDLSFKIQYKNSSEIAITLYASKIHPMIEKVYFEDDEIIENSQCKNIYFPKNFSCNHKTTTYFKNGNVNSVCYYGTETFKMGKKFYKNYENGAIKSEGIYGQNISFFDTQGTLINITNIDDKTACGNENKDETGKDEIDRILGRYPFDNK